jgi:hypothetical protein
MFKIMFKIILIYNYTQYEPYGVIIYFPPFGGKLFTPPKGGANIIEIVTYPL